MDRKEAESLLGVTHATLQNWVKAGKLRATVENGIITDYNDEDVYKRLKITPQLIIHKIIVSINKDIDSNSSSALNLAKSKSEVLDKLVKNIDNLGFSKSEKEETKEDVEDIIKDL
jgi:DNA-binding transcriptional regulator LsrR (DeoR family)